MARVGNATYNHQYDFPEILPVFPLAGVLVMPGGQMPFNIFEPRYLKMVSDALNSHHLIGMIQPNDKQKKKEDDKPILYEIGSIGRITAWQESGDGCLAIHLTGACRFRITKEVELNAPYRSVAHEIFPEDLSVSNRDDDIDRDDLLTAFKNFLTANGMDADWENINQADNIKLVNALCMLSPFSPEEKQALLEAKTLRERAETLIAISEIYLAGMAGPQGFSIQ